MQAGTRLDHYEIVDKIGEGGMGAVYRAQDTRLKREVAIKVLPPEVSADPERLARLEREAQLLASLNHPNVATIHGFGEADVQDNGATQHVAYLAMELVEGESLYSRAAAGPIAWREAVQIAAGIASGLEAAHERGIVHRDLKPANVHLTPEGTVKVLDFGLAKAFDADGQSGSLELSASPTVAAATRTGLILGTAAYMSPEQARGKAVDKRADIWALGCVLYEMLSGQRAFQGETVSDILAAILKEQADLESLPAVPDKLRGLLERLLQKDPKDRMRDVGDVRLELEASLKERARVAAAASGGTSPFIVAALAAAALVLGLTAGWVLRPFPAPPESRVILDAESSASSMDALAVSPDGRWVAEIAAGGIRIRAMDDFSWRELADTVDAFTVAFDASSERLYFSRGSEVLAMSIQGSSPIVEASLGDDAFIYGLYRGADGGVQASAWKDGESIGYAIGAGGGATEIWRADGRTYRPVATTQLSDELWIGYGASLAGSTGLVLLHPGGAEAEPFLTGYTMPVHVGDGEMLAVDDRGRLSAFRVEPATGAVTAPPVVRVEGLAILGGGSAAYDLTEDGSLVFVQGSVSQAGETLAWLDRAGNQTAVTARTGVHQTDSRMSPDGLSVALEVPGDDNSQISQISVWVHDLERDVRASLTPGIRATFPVWSPDGTRIALRLGEGIDPEGIYVVPVDRSEVPQLLLAEPEGRYHLPMDWSPDGTELLYIDSSSLVRGRAPDNDLWLLPLDGGEPEVFLATGASEVDGRFSPDGSWVAYMSDQSGAYEVYVRPTAGGGEVQVSAAGGVNPEWNASADELFFTRGREIFAADFRGDAARPVGAERKILDWPRATRAAFLLPAPDGERFLVSSFGDVQGSNSILAILNWNRDPQR